MLLFAVEPFSCETHTKFMVELDETTDSTAKEMNIQLANQLLSKAAWVYRKQHSWVVFGLKHHRQEKLTRCVTGGNKGYNITMVRWRDSSVVSGLDLGSEGPRFEPAGPRVVA